jgi:hypothetical protein
MWVATGDTRGSNTALWIYSVQTESGEILMDLGPYTNKLTQQSLTAAATPIHQYGSASPNNDCPNVLLGVRTTLSGGRRQVGGALQRQHPQAQPGPARQARPGRRARPA